MGYVVYAQEVKKENLSKKQSFYWDFGKTKLQSIGSYYVDVLGQTTFKHGKWKYYDENNNLIEQRNYYKGELNGQVLLLYPNGKQRQEGYFKMDRQDSVYREWFESGQLNIETFYKNGQEAGIKRIFYFDGKQQAEEEYIDSVRYVRQFWLPDSLHTQTLVDGNGEATYYYHTGTIKEWYTYKNGLPEGEFVERSIYGYDLLTGHFQEGKKHGQWKYFYYTGDVEKIMNYEHGKLTGKYQYFYDNKQINVEGYYKNGLKDGEWVWYTKQGKRDMQGSFLLGLQEGKWTYWFPTGELSYTAVYKANKKSGTWNYFYKDGTKFKRGEFADDEKHGSWETWYENGKLLMTGNYVHGKEEGLWQNYWENGNLKNESTFKSGVLHGSWLSYFPNGKLRITGAYKMGYKTGEWISYFDNNKPKDIYNYKVIKKKAAVDYGPMKGHVVYESVKNGKFVSFSQKDFQKTEEGGYKNDEKEGTWTAYYPGGKYPANTMDYKKGKLHGKVKEYDRKGAIITEIDYKDGLKHGKMKLYDKKGKVTREKKFEKGMEVIEGTSGGGGFNPGN